MPTTFHRRSMRGFWASRRDRGAGRPSPSSSMEAEEREGGPAAGGRGWRAAGPSVQRRRAGRLGATPLGEVPRGGAVLQGDEPARDRRHGPGPAARAGPAGADREAGRIGGGVSGCSGGGHASFLALPLAFLRASSRRSHTLGDGAGSPGQEGEEKEKGGVRAIGGARGRERGADRLERARGSEKDATRASEFCRLASWHSCVLHPLFHGRGADVKRGRSPGRSAAVEP